MNEKEQSIFFALLRSAIWQKEADAEIPDGGFDWETVVDALDRHKLLAFVGNAIMSMPEDRLPDAFLQERILECVANTVKAHYRLNRTICDVFEILEKEGHTPVLLKGQGISQLYPIGYVRSCGDIDVFIGKERFWDACDIVNNYCDGTGEKKKEHITIHWSAYKGDIDIEVHQVAADTAMHSIKEEYNEWAEINMKGKASANAALPNLGPNRCVCIDEHEIRIPGDAFNSIYIFEHLLKHLRGEGVGLRQFVDWLIVLKSAIEHITDEQRKDMKVLLEHLNLLDAWQVMGGILVWQLGVKKEDFPFWNERKARYSQGHNLRYIIEADNLGEGTANAKGYYNMAPSRKRDLLALHYYIRHIAFEYHVFPKDTVKRTFRRIWKKL